MEQQLEKLTQAILARGELIKQLQIQCEAIHVSVGEMKPIRPEVKAETKPAAPVVADSLLRAEALRFSTTDQRLGPSSRRDEVTSLVDLKADLQRLVLPIRDSPQSMTTPAQASLPRLFATGELDALMPTGCSMNCPDDDTDSRASAFMPDAASGPPSTAAMLDVVITSTEPIVAALLVRDGTSVLTSTPSGDAVHSSDLGDEHVPNLPNCQLSARKVFDKMRGTVGISYGFSTIGLVPTTCCPDKSSAAGITVVDRAARRRERAHRLLILARLGNSCGAMEFRRPWPPPKLVEIVGVGAQLGLTPWQSPHGSIGEFLGNRAFSDSREEACHSWDCNSELPAKFLTWLGVHSNFNVILKHLRHTEVLELHIPNHPDLEGYKKLMEEIRFSHHFELLPSLEPSGHALGSSMVSLIKRCSGLRKLLLFVRQTDGDNACSSDCICHQPSSWRDKNIHSDSLEELQVKGLRGTRDELDFLRCIFRSATANVLKKIAAKFSESVEPSKETYEEIMSLPPEAVGIVGKQKSSTSTDLVILPFWSLSLVFDHINYFVDMPKEMAKHGVTDQKLQLLQDVRGAFRPGVLTALMEITSAGKTKLHMEGFGVNTYTLINRDGKPHLVKFHWKPTCGVKSLLDDEAVTVGGTCPSPAPKDLTDSIAAENYPEWQLYIQTIDPDDGDRFGLDSLDVAKTWTEDIIPLQPVGRLVLNKNIDNFFAGNEQLAFGPAITIPRIHYSDDKLLQTRILSYADTQMHRLDPIYLMLPVIAPKCAHHNNHHDVLSVQGLETLGCITVMGITNWCKTSSYCRMILRGGEHLLVVDCKNGNWIAGLADFLPREPVSFILLEDLTYHTREESKPWETTCPGCFHDEAELDTVQQKRGGLLTSTLGKYGLRCAYELQAQAGCLGA